LKSLLLLFVVFLLLVLNTRKTEVAFIVRTPIRNSQGRRIEKEKTIEKEEEEEERREKR